MMAMMKSIDLLGRERPIVARERARGAYGATEYVIASLIASDCIWLPLIASDCF